MMLLDYHLPFELSFIKETWVKQKPVHLLKALLLVSLEPLMDVPSKNTGGEISLVLQFV